MPIVRLSFFDNLYNIITLRKILQVSQLYVTCWPTPSILIFSQYQCTNLTWRECEHTVCNYNLCRSVYHLVLEEITDEGREKYRKLEARKFILKGKREEDFVLVNDWFIEEVLGGE